MLEEEAEQSTDDNDNTHDTLMSSKGKGKSKGKRNIKGNKKIRTVSCILLLLHTYGFVM